MSLDSTPIHLLMHCLEYLDPNDWSTYISLHADSPEIRQRTLEMMNSHTLKDQWLPADSDDSRISIKDQWSGAVAISPPKHGDQFIDQDIQLGEILGRGTANVVFHARQIRVPSNCFVIKTPTHCNQPERRLAQYTVEHDIQSRAYHPNVARVLSFGVLSEDRPFLAIELLEGVKLGDFLTQSNQSLTSKLRVMTQIISAIAELHQRGISHGDLNADNVIVVEREGLPVPKIIDFGRAMLDCTTSELPPRKSVRSICEVKQNGEDCASCKLDVPFRANLARDLKSISHLLNMFLTAYDHDQHFTQHHSDEILQRLVSLQRSIQCDIPSSHRSKMSEVAEELESIELMVL